RSLNARMRSVREKEKLSLLLAAAIPDPAKLLFHLSTTPRLSEESDHDSESDREGAADEGVEGWMEKREDEGRRRARNGEAEGLDWLSDCIIESWGGLEYVALARSSSVALLGRRGDGLSILFAKPMPMEVGEEISSILLMGVGSRRVSGSIDGIILLVGTSDGRLSLLSESSALLFAHRFVHSPITAMRTTNENVLLISEHEMVQIDRKSLYTLVSEARKMNGGKKRVELDFTVLNRLSGETSMDAVAAPFGPTTMDRYAECSMKKFHGRMERSRGDVVYWLSLRESYGASGVWDSESREGVRDTIVKWGTQYLPTFLQSAMQSPELVPHETKSAVSWRVMGESRFAISLHPAPAGSPLVAVADNLARVAIVESTTGQIVRVWKGYRDASCGWIRVRGEGDKRALFLAILAPRRNLLEIWSAPNGRRVAARQVRGLALLESSSQVLSESLKRGKGADEGEDRLFLLGYKGNLYEIRVAFESLLQLNTDDEQHDRILLKETELVNISFLPSLVASLKTGAARRMALISYIHMARTVEQTEPVLRELTKFESLAPLCTALLSLCQSYSRLRGLCGRKRAEEGEEREEEGGMPDGFDEEAYGELRPLIEKILEEGRIRDESRPPTLFFSPEVLAVRTPMIGLSEFLTSFNMHTSPLKLTLLSDPSPFLSFLFTPLMEQRVDLDEFVCAVAALHIGQSDLSSLFTQFWSLTDSILPVHLTPSIHILGSLVGRSEEPATVGRRKSRTSSTSSLSDAEVKERMEEVARKSTDPLRGSVLLTLLSLFSHHERDDEFESVREDVQRLEGVLRVAPLLSRMSALSPDSEPITIEALMEGGTTVLREQVARVVSMDRLLPAQLLADPRLVPLREALPHSLDCSLLCAETAWTLMREWTGKSSFESARLAVEYAKAVVDRRLRCQLASLLWSTTLLGALKAVSNQSRGAERDLHAQLVPTHRVADFIICLFSLLSSLVPDVDGDEEAETLLESERARVEEWIEPVIVKKDKGAPSSSSSSSIKCESLVDVLHRQPDINDSCLYMHRMLLAAAHVTMAVGRSPSAVRDLFPTQLHGVLFSNLSSRVRSPDDEEYDVITKRRAALIERACNYPNPSTRDSLLFLCGEWQLMDMWQASDARRCLREGRCEEGCMLLATLPYKTRVAILTPAVAARLKMLAVDMEVMLSTKDERTLSDLCGDEFVDDTCADSTKKLMHILKSWSSAANPTKQLLLIGKSYFGLDV
ncbi:rbg-2, partial [Pristionchus pacificus]